MEPFVTRLYDHYCMNENSFTEAEYREYLGTLLEGSLNVEAVRLNLPFQLISKHCQASTMLLGNTFEALAQRPEDSKTLKTLVIENMTDIGIVRLWRNPQDVKNIMDTFVDLRHLVISVRRHEDDRYHTIGFQQRLWEMIGKAGRLETLCLVSLNMDELPFQQVKHTTQRDCTLSDWHFRSIPTIRKPPKSILPHLTSLELRRVEILPCGFLSLFRCFGSSLKELILNHVYLKTCYHSYEPDAVMRTLWIGLPNQRPQQNHRWIATALREMDVRLRVCRVTNIGYDQYLVGAKPAEWPRYDLDDPCGLGRSLDQRFVEAVMGMQQPGRADGKGPVEYWPEEEDGLAEEHDGDADADEAALGAWAGRADRARPEPFPCCDWDAVTYYAADHGAHNSTSAWQRTIDGYFANCNQFTLDELHRFADTACEGMNELNRWCAEAELSSSEAAADAAAAAYDEELRREEGIAAAAELADEDDEDDEATAQQQHQPPLPHPFLAELDED